MCNLINNLFYLYFILLLIRALMSWINPDPYNPIVRTINMLTEPVLAPFRAGDSRSGEIDAMSAAETGSTNLRATLLLRQLGPDDGWFVIGAINPMVSIDTPEAGSVIPAGPLSVAGAARGYEATIIVKAFVAGTTELVVDPAIAMGGSMETPEPYATHLDLSFATPGTVIALVVRGDTGLETDPGEFSAIPLVIGG